MTPRPKVPRDVEAGVLLRCRRRCAICFGLNRDASDKRGQIAHLDRERANNKPDNLAYLCLEHHDLYDSRTSQSKGLTKTEVKVFRAELEEAMGTALSAPVTFRSEPSYTPGWEGVFRWESSNASAELRIDLVGTDEYSIRGFAFWGIRNRGGPNIGELDGTARLRGDRLSYQEDGYELTLTLQGPGLTALETSAVALFGMNVTFGGQYHRVPAGAEALPQPPMRPFESEFWPEEGIPVLHARGDSLVVRSRPTSEAPVVTRLAVEPGHRVDFSGFRYRTVRPGRVVIREACTLTGRNLGDTDYVSASNYYEDGGESLVIQFRPGDQLEYLQYRAEGSGFIRWQGLVLDVDYLPWLGSDTPFEMLVAPVSEAWMRIEAESGAGWVLVDEGLEETGREF